MLTVPTTCPFCACGCGLYLLAKHDELVGVAPSEAHAVAMGRLCARGWGAHEAALWGNRSTQPMINRNGRLGPASWGEALDYVVGRLRKLLADGKPVGVLGSARATNEENYLAGKLARAGLGTNNLDFSYHSFCRPMFAGLEDVCGEFAPSVRLKDVESSEAILLLEGDVARSHPRAASAVMRAVEKGARLITVGCISTQMTRLASLHLPAMPGNEGEVLDALLAAVVTLELPGRTSAAPHSEGLDALRRDTASARITEEVRQAAAWFARAGRAVILAAPTNGQGDQGRRAIAALATLAAITGHLGKPGSGLLPLLARCNVRGACDMGVAPDRLPGYEPMDSTQARLRLQNLWGRDLPSKPGLDAESLVQSVSGLICVADDPPAVLPMGERATAALAKIEFLVVLDSFLTPTAKMAHVLLPIASYAETEGTFTNLEGMVQRLRAACKPPGEARSGWQVLAELCRRFGLEDSYHSAQDVLGDCGNAANGQYSSLIGTPGERQAEDSSPTKCHLHGASASPLTTPERPYVLARDGSYDWGLDPLVMNSPTLNRDFLSLQKLFPNGFVEIGKHDADRLGVHGGRRLKLSSTHGDAVVPARVRPDLQPGVVLVPYAFRDRVANVLGADGVAAVSVEQA